MGDAHENKKIVLKEQRKEKKNSLMAFKDQFEEKSLHWVQLP